MILMHRLRHEMPQARARVLALVAVATGCLAPSAAPAAEPRERPRLLTSTAEAADMRATQPLPALFQASVEAARRDVDPLLESMPDVPQPVDGGGGYTHERHKANAVAIYRAGQQYLLTGDPAYATFTAELLEAYATLYPDLGRHPVVRSKTPGRLFWQSLNESVWLVYAIQGYDAVYEALPADQRERLEQGLFRPLARFLSVESPETFDRVHNHGTWAVAAVGMTGYVLGDEGMVHQALYGLDGSGKGGFLRQLDELFSPDGYYAEGPYYQRYALMPFVLFAQAIDRNEPDRGIFEYRDGVLARAIDAAIQMTYGSKFFPINDAIKEKGLDTSELVFGVAAAFAHNGDPALLSIAEYQGHAAFNGAGFRLAQAAEAQAAQPFAFRSMRLSDGAAGDRGALDILRSGPGGRDQALVFKATAQGMGHGHFDRLAWLFYDEGREVVSDYGAARFLNVVEKHGGHYLPENESWAKQTVAHNTLVVDETSQFDGDWKASEAVPTRATFFEVLPGGGVAAATVDGAWAGVDVSRTLVMLQLQQYPAPLVIDRFRVDTGKTHRYDLPLYYQGQLTATSHPIQAFTQAMQAVGAENGYQHLWKQGRATVAAGENFKLTWLLGRRFYTWTTLASADAEVILTRTGAGDPEFNLRSEPGLLWRVGDLSSTTFVSVLEPHGQYDPTLEFTVDSASALAALRHHAGPTGDVIELVHRDGAVTLLALAHEAEETARHEVQLPGRTVTWSGYHSLIEQ